MGDTVYTWANFGRAAAAEEIIGGGPEDPAADLAVLGTAIVFGLGALHELTKTDSVRVSRTRTRDPCLVGPYGAIKDLCGDVGGETHHIVPDMVYRLGPRPTNPADMNSTAGRIPNSPTFSQGMSICLEKEQHRLGEDSVHPSLDIGLQTLGSGFDPSGTAPMPAILAVSVTALQRLDGVSVACREKAATAASAQTAPMVQQPGRTTQLLPSPAASLVLARGSY